MEEEEGKTERRKGKMEAGKGKSMKRRTIVEERGRDWEEPNGKVKSVQAKVDEGGGKYGHLEEDNMGFQLFP